MTQYQNPENYAKALEALLKYFDDFDPEIRKLGVERYLTGKNVFNSNKLCPHFRDRAQARGALIVCDLMGKVYGKQVQFTKLELKLLRGTDLDLDNQG